MEDTELDSSELGTQDYWQKSYTKEIENFEEHGDPGDVWFGEDSAQRVINWICDCGVKKDVTVIDLGCGNGYTLIELAKEGFTQLLGVDYCEEAILLAKKVSNADFPQIRYQVFNITEDNVEQLGKFGIVHDKGTYDAIGLNPDDPKRHRERYIEQVAQLLEDDDKLHESRLRWYGHVLRRPANYVGNKCLTMPPPPGPGKRGAPYKCWLDVVRDDMRANDLTIQDAEDRAKWRNKTRKADPGFLRRMFIITSCNWTEEELIKQFSEKLKLKRVIPTPQFKFGGKVGSVVSSVVFVKK